MEHITLAPTAFIIDLDGTMLDTLVDFAAGLNGVAAGLGWPPAARDLIGAPPVHGGAPLILSTPLRARAATVQRAARACWRTVRHRFCVRRCRRRRWACGPATPQRSCSTRPASRLTG